MKIERDANGTQKFLLTGSGWIALLIILWLNIAAVNAQAANRFKAQGFSGTCTEGILSSLSSNFSWNMQAGYERWGNEGKTSNPNTVFLSAGPESGSVSVNLAPDSHAYYLKNNIHRGSQNGPVVASLYVVWMCVNPNGPAQVTYVVLPNGSGGSGGKAGPPAMNLFDGRINDHQGRDVGAEVAIYLGSIKVYAIDPANGNGTLAVDISSEYIQSVGVPTEANVLLGAGMNSATGFPIAVYRLTTGEFQLNTNYHDGKPYIFVWNSLLDHKYHLAS